MNVLFQYQTSIDQNYKEFFRSQLPDDIKLLFSDTGDHKKLLHHAQDADVFVGYSVTPEFMERATRLKHIQIPWTGFNSLDTELLQRYDNVTVSNSHSNSLAIAEHAIALLLSSAKLIGYRDRKMRKGDWAPRYEEVTGFWITGRNAGIVGYGAIGEKIAKILNLGFDMNIEAIRRSPYIDKDEYCQFIGGPDALERILETADFIIIGVPLTEETKGLIGERELSIMKDSSIIVNIARGPIIDEEALYNALKESKIGGAGIDVWYNYPQNPTNTMVNQNYPFEELDNIVLSPHSAFKVRERVEVFAEDILTNIRRVYHGKEPINQVNLELGY